MNFEEEQIQKITYEEAKALKSKLEAKYYEDADRIKGLEDRFGVPKGFPTPDHVRALPEWQEAKSEVNKSFAKLRAFNSWYVKLFKKEMAEERRNRYPQR